MERLLLSASSVDPITVVDYDSKWPIDFRAEADRLLVATAGHLHRIEHIGSTSVPGLAAKPTIDLMAEATQSEPSPKLIPLLAKLNYRHRPHEFTDRLLFSKGSENARTHNLHIVGAETLDQRNEILFRDRLRNDPELSSRYAALKRAIAIQDHPDLFSYSRAKTDFVIGVVNEERATRGYPPVNILAILGPIRRSAWIDATDV